jgi:hypothetical protein
VGDSQTTSYTIDSLDVHPSSRRPFLSRQAAPGALTGSLSCRIRLVFLQVNSCPPTTLQGTRRAGCKVISGPLTAKQNAPRQPSHLFLLFFDTHFLPPSSKYCCLHFFFFYFSQKTLHHLHNRPLLRVGSQEEKHASQESRQGREGPSRPAGQQPQERHRE